MAIYSSTTTAGDTRTDHLVDFKTKQKAPFIIEHANALIEQLVVGHNPALETCQAYYNSHRNPAKFKALTENYGVGSPNKLPFNSLMQRHVKALMGFFMQLPFPVTVSAIDRDSIHEAREEMATEAVTSLMQMLNQMAQQQWGPQSMPGPGGQPAPPAQASPQALQDIKRKAETYTSRLERFTSVLLKSLIERLQLRNKAASMVESRAVSGCFYYRVWLEENTQLPRLEWIPEHEMHHVRDKTLGPLREHGQVVRHRQMLRTDVLTRWGHLMSDEEKRLVAGKDSGQMEGLTWVPLMAGGERGAPRGQDEQGNPSGFVEGNYLDSVAVRKYGFKDYAQAKSRLIDVYEGEFTSPSDMEEEDFEDDEEQQAENTPYELTVSGTTMVLDKKSKPKGARQRKHVYPFVRIGSCVWLNTGRYKYAQRPLHDPNDAYLTYNGIFGERSMILDTVDLQDKSDLLNYHQDNLIALGGVPGLLIDFNDIPKWFGKTNDERIMKFRGHLKGGLGLLDRSQQGRRTSATPDPSAFNNSGKVDTSFNGQSIAAIKDQLAYIDEVAERISGVPRQMQGDIEARDGLGTTNQALASASAVNRPLYNQIFTLLQDACTDMLNLARVTAKNNPELIASIIGTAGARLIGLGAERFPLANFNVFVQDAMEEKETLERLRQAGSELVAAMAVDPKLMINIASINNVAVLREILVEGVEDHAADKNAQLEQQNADLQKQLQQLQQADAQGKQQELAIQAKKVDGDLALGAQSNQLTAQKNQQDAAKDAADLENEDKRIALEGQELFYNQQSLEVANGPK